MSKTLTLEEFFSQTFSKEFLEETKKDYDLAVQEGKVLKRVQEAAKDAPRVAVEILWSDNWYNGPCDGMCIYQGERLFYTYVDDVLEPIGDRVYAVVKIDPNIRIEMERRHYVYEYVHSGRFDDELSEESLARMQGEIDNWIEISPWWGDWEVVGKFRASQVAW